ncbi:MAG: glycosyltransferase [Chitinophagaceae bacterium]|nr:MAG: glycosyltransferase [Chitinophagaceae bacterium]
MKYWLLTTEYPPFYGGGIGTYCVITGRMLADAGHDVTIFVSDVRVKDFTESIDNGVRLVRFNTSRTGSSAYLGHVTNIAYEFAHIIRHFVGKESPPDIIESQEYLGIAYYLLQYKWLLEDWCKDIPVVLTIHSPTFLYLEYNEVNLSAYPVYWICEMERFCLRAADLLLSPSAYIVTEIEKRFPLHRQVTVIPNPFEAKSLGIQDTGNVAGGGEIIYYGKLSPQKGSFHLLRYFAGMWDAGFTRPLLMIGGQEIVYHPEGLMMGEVLRKRFARYEKQGLLKLEQPIRHVDVAKRLAGAAVVIVPSYHDNLPYVVFEMMSLGLVVLVSKQGGQAEIVNDGIDGFVFDHLLEGSFEERLRLVLALDPAQRAMIGEAARMRVKNHFSPAVIAAAKIPLLENLLAQPAAVNGFPVVRAQPVTVALQENAVAAKGLLSVVVPYYNMGRYIDETIRSIEASAYKPTEIIIVNDGSSDEYSVRQLQQYREKENIRVIDKTNEGLAAARNSGAAASAGEYLAFLDADDTIHAAYHSRAIRILAAYANIHFAGAWVQYTEGSERIWPTFQPEPPLILYHNTVNSSGLVYKRESFMAAGLNDGQMLYPGLEDYDSVIGMVAAGLNGVIIPEPLFYYRVRQDSMIRGISIVKKQHLLNHVMAGHAAIYSKFAAGILALQNANGSGLSLDNPTLDKALDTLLPFGIKIPAGLVAAVKRNRFIKRMAYMAYKVIKK